MKEEWRDVSGHMGYYQISNLGRVRSLDRCIHGRWGPQPLKGRVMKPFPSPAGYLGVALQKEGNKKYCVVARLVALAFIPNPDNLPEVDHINEEKTDNRAANLQWITQQENVERSQAKTYFFRSPAGELVEVFNLSKYCGNHGLSTGNMCAVHGGKRNHHKGWRAAKNASL